MRVISGVAGGLRLDVPGTDLRPTMDKVKGAIFSSLGDFVTGARVLDLFAGCGGLGIEALSRGAASAVFVEQNKAAVDGIQSNLARVKLAGVVVRANVHAWIDAAPTGAFDLILADPPYKKNPSKKALLNAGARGVQEEPDHAALLLLNPALPRLLAEGGVLVLEKDPTRALPETPFWEVLRCRGYGKTDVVTLAAL